MPKQHRTLSAILRDKTISSFDRDVYKVVASIRKGEVRSYGWVAKKIWRPRAYRAVGNALGRNPYPWIVPCHRVIRSDRSIGGYAKGTEAKRRLLKSEGVDSDF